MRRGPTPNYATKSQLSHQPRHRARATVRPSRLSARHATPCAPRTPEVLLRQPFDLRPQLRVTPRSGRQAGTTGLSRLGRPSFQQKQAETLAEEHVALLNANLATKADIAAVKASIEAVKADLLKWLFGALIAQGGLIVALVKFL